MKIFLLTLLLFSALSDILCQNFSPDEEDNWTSDRYPDKVNLLESDLQTMLEKVNRAPGLQQVFGLMGKRSSAKSQITRRRQKFQTFVGLMGKRNVAEPGSYYEKAKRCNFDEAFNMQRLLAQAETDIIPCSEINEK